MNYTPFMFDAGNTNDVKTYTFNGKSLNITKEDYDNWFQNGLDEDLITTMSFSYLSKQMFEDFSGKMPPMEGGTYEF